MSRGENYIPQIRPGQDQEVETPSVKDLVFTPDLGINKEVMCTQALRICFQGCSNAISATARSYSLVGKVMAIMDAITPRGRLVEIKC